MTDATRSELIADHLGDLRKSGLTDDTIAAMQVRSLTAVELKAELGYLPHRHGCRPDHVESALALAYSGLNFTRYKLFPPAVGKDGREQRYAQAEGTGVHLYALPSVRAVLTDATVPLYWTEGEKKAAKATQEGFLCIALGGLWNWLRAGTSDAIAELEAIMHARREEIIAPDSDVWMRLDLKQAVYAFGKELEAHGASVSVVIIPSPDGVKVGLDDFLVAHGVDVFRELTRIPLKDPAFTKQREWYPTWRESRTTKAKDAGQGQMLALTDPEPWPDPMNGAELLDDIARVFSRYVILPAGAADAAALWALHTYLIDVLQLSPILGVTSPQKRCGKSTLLDVLRALVRRAVGASNISAAALFRTVEAWTPTLLIDEADTFLAEREELRGILNAGHTRSTAQVVRTVGDDHEPRVFGTFCAKGLAAIGELPGTIEDRAIMIRMQRRAPGEHVERLRRDRIDRELEALRRKAARWAADRATAIRDAEPDVPEALNDRAADNWRPLLAIADAAGGAWRERARRAALLLSATGAAEDSDVRVQLLADIRDLFEELRADKLASETIVEALIKLENRPWPEWRRGKPITATGLARLLRPFGVASKTIRIGTDTPRGYERADFADAWHRYLCASNHNTATTPDFTEPGNDYGPQHAYPLLHFPAAPKPAPDADCGSVALRKRVVEV
jgi:hypothetical protein